MNSFFASIMMIRRILTHEEHKDLPIELKKLLIAEVMKNKFYTEEDDDETTEIKNLFGSQIVLFLMDLLTPENLLELIEKIWTDVDPGLKELLDNADAHANEAIKLRHAAESIIKEGGLKVEI